jgi:hypothetical protein
MIDAADFAVQPSDGHPWWKLFCLSDVIQMVNAFCPTMRPVNIVSILSATCITISHAERSCG